MRIELFQDLYERYSRLDLSYPSDRPFAIKGLEIRLIDTFGTTGGYGIFELYLHRCLLWKRSGKTLKRLKLFRGDISVPSWSWMAYDGPISYMAVPFGQVLWQRDITSPFAKDGRPDVLDNRHENSESGVVPRPLELEAPVREIVSQRGAELFFDRGSDCEESSRDSGRESRIHTRPLHCVVVAKTKRECSNKRPAYYVLLVADSTNVNEGRLYERVGVGILEKHHMAHDRPTKMARIR
jgi:hypothetical protein